MLTLPTGNTLYSTNKFIKNFQQLSTLIKHKTLFAQKKIKNLTRWSSGNYNIVNFSVLKRVSYNCAFFSVHSYFKNKPTIKRCASIVFLSKIKKIQLQLQSTNAYHTFMVKLCKRLLVSINYYKVWVSNNIRLLTRRF